MDDYSEGVPEVVPAPIRASDLVDGGSDDDGGSAGDAGSDAGKDSGAGTSAGGSSTAGGSSGGGGSAEIGDSCKVADDCADDGAQCLTSVNLVITTLEFPGGYCSQMQCQSDNECPAGSGCLALTRSCLQTCTRNSQCRTSEGYECATPPLVGGTAKYCLPQGLASLGSSLGGLGGLLGGTGGAGGLGALGGLFGGTAGGR